MHFVSFAYIDPGAGSILLQLVLASVIGAVYRFRDALRRMVDRFRKR